MPDSNSGYVMINPYGEVFDYPEFVTHSNYVSSLSGFATNLNVNIVSSSNSVLHEPAALRKKIKLIQLTHKNLIEEMRSIESTIEYSQVCVSWLPVKSYYLYFNLLLTLHYLITGNDDCFNLDHKKLHQKQNELLRSGAIAFSEARFNKLYSGNEIISWQIPAASNLIRGAVDLAIRNKQIIKKLYEYKRQDYKKIKGIKRLAGQAKIDFNNSVCLSLSDFFYIYRIKANYRDMEFIDMGVPAIDFYKFYKDYFSLTMNYYDSLKNAINSLSTQRLGRDIL